VGQTLVQRHPERLTQEFSKADRGGRIYVDTGRNGYSATFAAAYAVRAKPGAPISAPCTWEEVERGDAMPQAFTLRNILQRIADAGDAWADYPQRGSPLASRIKRISAR
jgi:bifunctional non-homologous end joining protein LigD